MKLYNYTNYFTTLKIGVFESNFIYLILKFRITG